MKGKTIKLLVLTFVLISLSTIAYAGSTVPFFYNVLPVEKNNSIIDKNLQKTLTFNLYQDENEIFFNDEPVKVINNSFEIDISKLEGKQTFEFVNDNNEKATFTYYISDSKGKVDGYKFEKANNVVTYVKTVDGIKVIYTNKEQKIFDKVENIIKKIPSEVKVNVDMITLVPYTDTNKKVAGITSGSNIKLYKISSYSGKTLERIIIHEVAHTFADELIRTKVIDYSYTEYSKTVKADKKNVSTYSKSYTERNLYNEDFADSMAELIMNQKAFEKKFPNRAKYLLDLFD